MLAPHELKNKEFNKSLRGYSTEEVDEHIDFLIEKYTELYRANDELEKQLRLVQSQLDAMKADEEAIRSALVNAQKASNRIIDEANDRADVIMTSAKNSCDKMIDDAKASVRAENEKLRLVREQISTFKRQLYDKYQKHIELIESITPDSDIEIKQIDEKAEAEFSKKVVERIKNDLTGKDTVISGASVPFSDEAESDTNTAGQDEPYVRVSAEENIPDHIAEKVEVTESIRDKTEFEDNQLTVVESEPDEGTEEEISAIDPSAFTDAIPDSDKSGITDDELTLHIRRAGLFDTDGAEETSSDDDETGGSIINAIKQINKEAGKSSGGSDEEEFMRIINSLSGGSGKSSSAEFNKAYDEKKI